MSRSVSKTVQDMHDHNYNGIRVGTCMRSIEWCYFQCGLE